MKMNLQKFAGKTTNQWGRNLDSNGCRRMAESINDSQSPYYYA